MYYFYYLQLCSFDTVKPLLGFYELDIQWCLPLNALLRRINICSAVLRTFLYAAGHSSVVVTLSKVSLVFLLFQLFSFLMAVLISSSVKGPVPLSCMDSVSFESQSPGASTYSAVVIFSTSSKCSFDLFVALSSLLVICHIFFFYHRTVVSFCYTSA